MAESEILLKFGQTFLNMQTSLCHWLSGNETID